MTFAEACGVKNPNAMAHADLYDRYIAHIGYTNLIKYLPAKPREIAEAYLADRNLNNIPLSKWEQAAGYPGKPDHQGEPPRMSAGPFRRLLESSGITQFSSSECVCLLKHTAERMALDIYRNIMDPTQLELWAVFEHWNASPDGMSKRDIYDHDCIALFSTEQEAIAFEAENPEHRVRKIIHDTRAKKKGAENK